MTRPPTEASRDLDDDIRKRLAQIERKLDIAIAFSGGLLVVYLFDRVDDRYGFIWASVITAAFFGFLWFIFYLRRRYLDRL
jgi:hypothetical protein